MWKLINRITTLYKNIKFLSGNDLKRMYKNLVETSIYYNSSKNIDLPHILTSDESLDMILNSDKSLIRFGDGEYRIIEGYGIPCQKYDKSLSERLRYILKSKENKIIIGINREYYYPNKYNPLLNEIHLEFRIFSIPYYRNILNKLIDYDTIYCNSSITTISADMVVKGQYEKFRKIWNKKNILIVTNKNMLEKIKYNIFDNALNCIYIHTINKCLERV